MTRATSSHGGYANEIQALPRDALSHRWIHRQCKWTFVRWKKRFLHVYISAPRETLETRFANHRELWSSSSSIQLGVECINTDKDTSLSSVLFERELARYIFIKRIFFRGGRLISSSINQRFQLRLSDFSLIVQTTYFFLFFLGYFEWQNVFVKENSFRFVNSIKLSIYW